MVGLMYADNGVKLVGVTIPPMSPVYFSLEAAESLLNRMYEALCEAGYFSSEEDVEEDGSPKVH